MKKKNKVRSISQVALSDDLDKLLNTDALDEIGLLDLLFVEEILNQRENEKHADFTLQASNY